MLDREYMPDVFGSHFTLPDLGPVGERLTPSCVDAEPWQISTALPGGVLTSLCTAPGDCCHSKQGWCLRLPLV